MSKSTRQSKILDIVSSNEIDTQEELVYRLKQAGFEVTQATISRDIKELNLVKTLAKNDVYKYTQLIDAEKKISLKYLNLFKEAVISVTAASNTVVVVTLEHCAETIASVVREMQIKRALGVVAFNDTVLIVAATEADSEYIVDKLSVYLG